MAPYPCRSKASAGVARESPAVTSKVRTPARRSTTTRARAAPVPSGSTSAATSSLEPVQGADQIYLASYATVAWTGDVKAYDFAVDKDTGEITKTVAWSVLDSLNQLDASAGLDYAPVFVDGLLAGQIP